MSVPAVGKPSPMRHSGDVRMGVIKSVDPLAVECDGVLIDNGAIVMGDGLAAVVGDSCLLVVFGSGLYWVFSVKGGS